MGKRRMAQRGRMSVVAFLLVALFIGVLPQTALVQPGPDVPIPSASIEPDTIQIFPGETFTFDVTFENAADPGSGNVGYGPEITVTLPAGITFDSAESSIFGPLTPQSTTSPLVFRLPVGSYTPEQVADTITITATAADDLRPDGSALPEQITATSRFIFGSSPTGNTPIQQADPAEAEVIPVLYIPYKDAETRFGEDETATGPNYPIVYTLGANIANGATIHDMQFTEHLPDNLQFTGITDIELAAGNNPIVQISFSYDGTEHPLYSGPYADLSFPIDAPEPVQLPANAPGGTLTVLFAQATGTPASLADDELDVRITFEAFVPEYDASEVPVIDPTAGGSAPVENRVAITASHATGPFGDPQISLLETLVESEPVEITAHAIAVQKHLEVIDFFLDDEVLSPDAEVRFRLESQISDYFSFDQIAIQDVLGDGYQYIAESGRLTFLTENGSSLPGVPVDYDDDIVGNALDLSGGAYPAPLPDGQLQITPGARPGETGGSSPGFTTLTFDVSGLEVDGSPIDQLVGGAYQDGSNATGYINGVDDDTRFTITFDAQILRDYQNSGSYEVDSSIDAFDELHNNVLVSGRIFGQANFNTETSSTEQVIPGPELTKSLVAINGETWDESGLAEVMPGDDVTFEIRVDIPTGNLETLTLTDFLPMPIFDVASAGSITFGGACGGFPATASACWAPDTSQLLVDADSDSFPTVTTNPSENSISFDWTDSSTFEVDTPQLVTVAVQFTMTVTNDPFHDDLHLTNVVLADYGNSAGPAASATGTAGFILRQPVMDINKSVSPTSADAGDTVTYTITVENTGGYDAYDVGIRDTTIAGLPLTGYTVVSVVDAANVSWSPTGNLFSAGGLTVPGPVEPGAQIIVTVTATVTSAAEPGQALINTAELIRYFNQPDAPEEDNYITDPDNPPSDDATVTVPNAGIDKTITGTNQAFTEGNDVAIGEIVTYQVVITVPEGTSNNVVFRDTLDQGLAFVAGSFEAVSSNTTDMPIDPDEPTFSNPGGSDRVDGLIEVDFGTIVNSNTDNETDETITITYQAVVLNNSTNNNGTGINNSAVWEWDEGSVSDNAPNVTIVEAGFTVTKTASQDVAEGGDVIGYTITVTNSGSTTAHDVVFTDIVPAGLTYEADSFMHTGTGLAPDSISDSDPTGSGLTAAWAEFPSGASSTFLFEAEVNLGLPTGLQIDNVAEIIWTSLPGDPSTTTTPNGNEFACERSFPGDTSSCQSGADWNDYEATGDHTLTIDSPAFVGKALIETSERLEGDSDPDDENLDSNPPVQIGEELTYEIAFEFPAAVTENVVLADVLNSSASDGALELIGATLERNRAELTAENLALLDPGEALDVSMTVDGNVVTLDLGDVTNNATDGDPAILTLTLTYRVANIGGNNAGDVLTDHGELRYAGGTIATGSVSVTIAEPVVQVTKVADPTSITGGETVQFTITISNAAPAGQLSSATGFDWTITDELPAIYTSPSVVSTDPGDTGADITAAFTGNTLNATVDELRPGESVTITYQATVDPTVQFGEEITNTVDVQATSLRGPDRTGERTGSGGVNDLQDSSSQTTTAGLPTISKSISPLENPYAIGEVATFEIRAGAPVGTANNFVVTDVLDEGLVFDPGSLNVSLPGTSSATNEPVESNGDFFSYNPETNTITFDFGTLTIAEDGDVVITYGAYVENIIGNQSGTSLDNSASLRFDNPQDPEDPFTAGPATPESPVVVGEPVLNIEKAVIAGATGSQAGDTVTWEVEITNTGNTTAYQVDWEDVMPHGGASPTINDGLYNISNIQVSATGGGVFLNGTTTGLSPADVTVDTTVNPNDTISLPLIQIPPGSSVTVTFDAVLGDGVTTNQELVNDTDVTWSSLPEDPDDRARDGSGDPDDSNDPDDYRDDTSSSFEVDASLAISKSVDPTAYTIGQTVDYGIRVHVIQGITQQLVVTDELPDGLAYVGHSISFGHIDMVAGNDDYNTRLGTGQTVQFNFGDLSNPADNNPDNDYVDITITARVENVPGNQNGDVRTNVARADYVDANDDPQDAESDEREITIVEPELEITKSVVPTEQALGNLVTFTIRVEHLSTSEATAYDVQIVDVLPTGLTYEDGSVVFTNGGTLEQSGQELTFNFNSITLDDHFVEFTYQARIDTTAVVDQDLTNDAYLTWTSLPNATGEQDSGRTGSDGPEGELNDYADGDSATVTPTTAAFITIDKSVEDITDDPLMTEPGDILEYTVVVENTNGPVTGVVVTDPIPVSATYVEGSLTVTGGNGTPDDSGDPLVVTIGDMEDGAITTFTFQVQVNDFTPSGTIIENTATVDSDQTVPTSDEANRPVGVPGEASLRAEKRVALTGDIEPRGTINVGDNVTYTITITNTGEVPVTLLAFEDAMPEGVEVQSFNVENWNCDLTAGTNDLVECTYLPEELDAGATTTITIYAEVTGVGTHVNQGTVSSNEVPVTPTDGNDDPNDGEQPTEFTSVGEGGPGDPNIDVTKAVSIVREHNQPGSLNPDEDIRYTITIANTGSAPATDVRLTDEIPEFTSIIPPGVTTSIGAVVSPASQPPPSIGAPYEVEVNVGTIPAGEFATITIDLHVSEDHPVSGEVVNQAFVDFEENPGDPVPSDDPTTEDPDDPTRIPIDAPWIFDPPSGFKTVDPTGYPTLVWEMVWINPSNVDATNSRVTDPIPADTTYIDGSLTCEALGDSTTVLCEYDETNNQIVWEGSIAPDPGATSEDEAVNAVIITYETTIAAGVDEVSNQACAYWDSDGDGFIGGPDGDPDELDQVPVCTDDPTTTEPGDPTFWRAPDLTIDKTTAGPFAVGQQGTYVLTVSNVGAGASFNEITVTDVLPAGLTFVSASGDGWTCEYNASDRTITCVTDEIVGPGESLPEIVIVADVTAAALPAIVNAAVTGTDGDVNPDNDRDEIQTEVIPEPPVGDGSADWDGVTEPGLLCTDSCTSGSIFFPWVANDDDFGLGPADTSITIQNLENRDSYIFIYRGIGDGVLAGEDAWELATVAYLARYASKTFTPDQLGLEPGEGAPIGVAAYNQARVNDAGDLVINQVSIGGYAKQAAGGDNLPLTTADDDVVDGYNAFSCLEIGMFDDWYLPIVQTNVGPGGAWNTIIRVANYGMYDAEGNFNNTGNAAVTLRFFPSDDGSGSLNTGFQLQYTVNAGATESIDLSDYVPEGWVGSVHIYSDGAISAMADRYKADEYMLWLTTTASNPGHETDYNDQNGTQIAPYVLFAPDVRMDYFGWNSGINVANLVEMDNNVTIQYFNMFGNAPTTMTRRLAPHGMTYFYDPSQAGQNISDQDPASDVNDSVVGSALIWSDHPIAVAVDATKYPESDPTAVVGRIQGTTYNATANVYDWQAVPLVQKGNPATGLGATSGINIMNPNNVATQVDVHWFDQSGAQADNFGTSTVSIPAYANGFVYTMTQHNLPNGYWGSAIVTSTLPVVATSAQVDYQVGHDGGVIWNAYNPGGFYRSSGCHHFGPPFDQPVGGSVQASVVDDAGESVTGVTLTLYNDTAYEQFVLGNETSLGIPYTASGVTNVDGTILWTNVPEDVYWIEVTSVPTNGEGETLYVGTGTFEGPFTLETGTDFTIDLEISRRLF